MLPRSTAPTYPEEAAENVASVARVPRRILPDGAARDALTAIAAAGYDCRCYASGGEAIGVWCLWSDELARVRSDRDGRVALAEWRTHWRELVAEMGLAGVEGVPA